MPTNVSFQRTDLFEEPLPPGNDLIVCGDVLRWAEKPAQLQAGARRLIDALAPGGALVVTSSTSSADQVWRALHAGRRLALTEELRGATFRIQRYEVRPSAPPAPVSPARARCAGASSRSPKRPQRRRPRQRTGGRARSPRSPPRCRS